MRMKAKTRNELIAQCACFDLRKATRAVSRMYDDFLRDEGLNITQFSLLRVIRTEKELSISTLGRYMVMDRTSITRALAPLERDGLIDSRPGADKRRRPLACDVRAVAGHHPYGAAPHSHGGLTAIA